jgi:hypothetical protein
MNATLKRQSRRFPEPGRPFVDREQELALIQDKLGKGFFGKPMRSVVVCFSGAFGMGKSWLLVELENYYRDGQQTSASHPTIAARLDLNLEDSPAIWQEEGEQVGREPEVRLDRVKLIRELWRQFASQLGIEVPDLGWASADEWAKDFVREATTWATRMVTPLILLDTVDDLVRFDDKSFLWLEQHLVEPLAMTDRVLFVFASRGELRRWSRFQVRRRVDSHRLTAFAPDATCQEVKASLAVGEVLHRHTFGHPLVTDLLGTALEEEGIDLETVGQSELSVEPALMQLILQEVVDEILEDVPEEAAMLARYASVLRWVNVEPLRSFAEDLGLVEAGRGDAYYLDDLIGRLQAHHLLYWSIDRNTYEPDPVLRRLLTYFLELNEPARFRAAHLAAFDFHREHLSRYPQYLDRYVTELAYHRAVLARADSLSPFEPVEPQPPTLQEWWEQFLSQKAPPNPERWAELAKALEQDAELKDVLPPKDYARLRAEAQARAALPQTD